MELLDKFIPYGKLPYENVNMLTIMQERLLPNCPYLPILPMLEENESILSKTLSGFSSFVIKKKNVIYDQNKKFIKEIDSIYAAPTIDNTKKYLIQSPFKEEFLRIIKEHESHNACINLYGPFSLLQIIFNAEKERLYLSDKILRKTVIQMLTIKALANIYEIKQVSPETVPLIIFEEHYLNRLNVLMRKNPEITQELVVNLYKKIFDAIHSAGAIVAVRSIGKCNWRVPIDAGVDIISFDACRNPHNLVILAEHLTEFISKGGQLNYAIIPTSTERELQQLKVDNLYKKLSVSLEELAKAKVPRKILYPAVSVSLYGDIDHLPVFFAEKANIVATKFAEKISVMQKLMG